MRTVESPWESWRAVVAVLREKGPPSMLEHADRLEQMLEQHPPDQYVVSLSMNDNLFLRSVNWARWQLGIPLPVEGREVIPCSTARDNSLLPEGLCSR